MAQATDLRRPGRWPHMSYEDYLGDPAIPSHTEWVAGEVVEMMSVSRKHALLTAYLIRLLGAYLEEHPLGEVLAEPFNMKTGPDLPGRSPDVMFVSHDHADRLLDDHLAGPADLVVEVISPGTARVDRVAKFREYQAGGVAEYWIIDPDRELAEFFQRGGSGELTPVALVDGIYASRAIDGLVIRPEWLWARTPLKRIASELGLHG